MATPDPSTAAHEAFARLEQLGGSLAGLDPQDSVAAILQAMKARHGSSLKLGHRMQIALALRQSAAPDAAEEEGEDGVVLERRGLHGRRRT